MARAWLIDGKTIASKVRNPTRTCAFQTKDHGVKRKCPNCHYSVDNSDVCQEWPGLPAGVKFDPSDAELIEHLAAKCGTGGSKPHPFIDDFIPTVLEDGGICYTHPENLPGVKKDGSCAHFFHRTINAYATGQRKRRKIEGSNEGPVRWHKTGRTKGVIDNGVHKGCKKIMVLYKSSKKGMKPDRSNWVMHQYHLGVDEDEKEGDFVVSKIFYQPHKHIDAIDDVPVAESPDVLMFHTDPRTPNPNPPNPPRPRDYNAAFDNTMLSSPFEEKKAIVGASVSAVSAAGRIEDELGYPAEWLAGESQAEETPDLIGIDESLLNNAIFNPCSVLNSSGQNNAACSSIRQPSNGATGNNNNTNAGFGVEDLENIELDTPPYSILPDLQISSQDSIFGWFDDKM